MVSKLAIALEVDTKNGHVMIKTNSIPLQFIGTSASLRGVTSATDNATTQLATITTKRIISLGIAQSSLESSFTTEVIFLQ